MNRTIKFRGFNRKDNKWFYGNLSQFDGGDCAINDISVDPDTVGQFTGLLDKNGKEIYEGDILSTDLAIPRCEVVFRNGCFALRLNDGDEDFYDIISSIDESVDKTNYHTIIDNIHGNPELLNEK